MSDATYTSIHEAADVTDEILDACEDIVDGWHGDGRVDWEDVIDRLDGYHLADGSLLDLGSNAESGAIRHIKRVIRKRRAGG